MVLSVSEPFTCHVVIIVKRIPIKKEVNNRTAVFGKTLRQLLELRQRDAIVAKPEDVKALKLT